MGLDPFSQDDFELSPWALHGDADTDVDKKSRKYPHRNIFFVRDSAPIFNIAAENNWELRLIEFLPALFPDHAGYFRELIHCLQQGKSGAKTPPPLDVTVRVMAKKDMLGGNWDMISPTSDLTMLRKRKLPQ
jgi:hypothetical protein